MTRNFCVICSGKLNNIFILDNVPIKLCCTDIPTYKKYPLSFSQCDDCFTIQLDNLIPLNELYSDSHNYNSIGNTWENYFNLFISKIQPIIKNKIILEIGCPSGKIVLNLKENFQKWYIVEPNKNLKVVFPKNVFFIQDFFDEKFYLNEKVNVIIHSHLFEHIYDFTFFLKKCYDLLYDDGEMFFGVPDMMYFTNSNICPFLGIFFEHTCFLNKENITLLLNNNCFDVIEIIDYENHSTLYHCKKINKFANDLIVNSKNKFINYYDNFIKSIDIYTDYIIKCNEIIKNTIKDVYIFGASYNSQLLISLGLEIENIKGILDNCKEKQNKFLYGFNLKIYDPNVITNKNCIIILKNGYYVNEILKQIQELNINTEIIL
uniref:C-methyltransferase domain-containing protein n=1 Tax=viral metagenome TaxID=1070528 RepID=A0A6C0DKE2_9ZZZZ